ncbi:hypothetical protein [Thermococcus sp. JdF3]|nr:hypothetical protein [Thermococcus sp. JdF3]
MQVILLAKERLKDTLTGVVELKVCLTLVVGYGKTLRYEDLLRDPEHL